MKPQFVREVEINTGRKCRLKKATEYEERWTVYSPTGLALFDIYGFGDLIHGNNCPDMDKLQGTGPEERARRRRKGGV